MLPDAPTTLFVATLINGDEHLSQVAATRGAALHWLTAQIPDTEWEAFYDHLPEAERTGITRDRATMTSLDILTAYAGPSAPDYPDIWGNDYYLMTVTEQHLWVTTNPLDPPDVQ